MSVIDKRTGERINLSGLKAYISVGSSVINGTVKDISPLGFSVCNVEKKSMRASHQYKVAISGREYSTILPTKPRWVSISECGEFLEIGFKILYSPPSWKNFIEKTIRPPEAPPAESVKPVNNIHFLHFKETTDFQPHPVLRV